MDTDRLRRLGVELLEYAESHGYSPIEFQVSIAAIFMATLTSISTNNRAWLIKLVKRLADEYDVEKLLKDAGLIG